MATTKVTTSVLGDDAVATARIADDAVTTAKIADTAVTSAKLAADAVETASIADDAVTLAKMAGGTDGNLITYDASGDPAAVATGSSGQNLSSNGAGAAPTFTSGAWQLVSTTAITLTASLDTTGFESGFDYQVVYDSFLPVTDLVDVFFRLGTGSALSANYDCRCDAAGGSSVASATTEIQICETSVSGGPLGSDATNVNQAVVSIFNPVATAPTIVMAETMCMDGAATVLVRRQSTAAVHSPSTSITSCHLLLAGGNFVAQGTILVYRRKRA